jgi:DNA-binding transcriptional LysR family regulator
MADSPALELWRLRYFLAVADELHFGRAARRLGMSQPALSQQIAKLERDLDVRLLHRAPVVGLTAAGTELQRSGHRLLNEALRIQASVRAAGAGRSGSIRVLLTRSASGAALNDLLHGFGDAYPAVEVSTQSAWTAWNLTTLRDGDTDLAVALAPVEDDDLHVLEIGSEPLGVVLADSHPLLSEEAIDPSALVSEPFFFWPREQAPAAYDRLVASLWGDRGKPVDAYEPDILRLVERVQRERHGFTVAAWGRSRTLNLAGVAWRPLVSGSPRLHYALCWRKLTANPSAQLFADFARSLVDTASSGSERRAMPTLWEQRRSGPVLPTGGTRESRSRGGSAMELLASQPGARPLEHG